MDRMGAEARGAAVILAAAPAEQRSAAIAAAAGAMRADVKEILAANAADVAAATSLVDRLRLDESRIEAIGAALGQMAALPDVVGETIARWARPNGLDISRVRSW